MRRTFADELHKQMTLNNDIILLTGDLGYKMWDQIKKDYPKRFINCGASEQAMLDIAVGMAYDGKIPFVYSITPFLIYRSFETIRTYINHERLHIILVGSGRDDDYKHDGFSHDANDIYYFMDGFAYIQKEYPEDKSEVKDLLSKVIAEKYPAFISLKR